MEKIIVKNSTQLNTIEYFEDSSILRVIFKGGSTYEYRNVPRSIFDALNDCNENPRNESVGKLFHRTVKSNKSKFPYKKV